MSARHTPGPWTYESDHTHRQYNIRMLGRDAQHICTVNNLPPHILANREQSTAEANARLIAAAPDLARALADLLADAVEMGLDDSPVSGSLIAAREALGKAGVL
jgi:hypothetical protein